MRTISLFVHPGQDKRCIPGVIKADLLPDFTYMTTAAVIAVATEMRVISQMTAITVRRGITVQPGVGVTGCAGRIPVAAHERECGVVVIKSDVSPALRNMTAFTFITVVARMDISNRMTADTGSILDGKLLIQVTTNTICVLMGALQQKSGGSMIKRQAFAPTGGLMTAVTLLTQRILVYVQILVTSGTVGWRFPELPVLLMTPAAIHPVVHAGQFKACCDVIKICRNEIQDVGAPAFMFGVAGIAFCSGGQHHLTMETTAGFPVIGNLLMATKAK